MKALARARLAGEITHSGALTGAEDPDLAAPWPTLHEDSIPRAGPRSQWARLA